MTNHFAYTLLDKKEKPYSGDQVIQKRSEAEKMAQALNKNANLECISERAPFRVVELNWSEL